MSDTYRGLLQALLFDMWRDEVLSEQQCAKYHDVDLVSMRRIFDCEAARRGFSSREDAVAAVRPLVGLEVLSERRRQQSIEGWTTEHDDEHTEGDLAAAAGCYALHGIEDPRLIGSMWPWGASQFKPKDKRRNYVRAAALLIAEIERLDRAAIAKASA